MKPKNNQATFLRLSEENRTWLDNTALMYEVSMTYYLNKVLDEARIRAQTRETLPDLVNSLDVIVERLKQLDRHG